MTVKERLIKYLDSINESKSEFGRKIGVSNAFVSSIRVSIQPDKLKSIALNYPELNTNWLITGEGAMLKSGSADGEKTFPSKINDHNFESSSGIPLYRNEAAAGFGTDDFAVEEKDIEARYKIRELETASFMLHVRGDSMSPNYNNGDIIAVRTVLDNRSIQWGKPHLVSSRVHGLLLKRIYEDDGNIIAVSDNPTYRPVYIKKTDITGIASVMGSIKFENYN